MECDVLVIGGGHAGIEAAHAAAMMGKKTILLTLHLSMMGNMPCNPHIGGSAKGILVRELDALGGLMGIAADISPLQIKMLNTGKGPGVQCLRAQEDKTEYPRNIQLLLKKTPNLSFVEGEAISLLNEGKTIVGVRLKSGEDICAKATILTSGTYLEASIFRGPYVSKEGPDGEKGSYGLSSSLKELSLPIRRFKTGTPPRLKKSSIDFSKTDIQPGMEGELAFSYTTKTFLPLEKQLPCFLTYTNEETIRLVHFHLKESSLHNGLMHGIGPRYCPSIEAKVERFPDKIRHQLFLEPEFREGESIYLQGFSNGFAPSIQEELVHTLPGLEKAEFLKYAYQIEYDCLDPLSFGPDLKSKLYEGLYAAGQVLGTSGYEEAATLGFMAGVNAALALDNKPPFVLQRDEAYIGVMIDDLVNKGAEEPYRLMSSRAEHRLLLRHDNADFRLAFYGHDLGTLHEEAYQEYLARKERIDKTEHLLHEVTIPSNPLTISLLEKKGYFDGEKGHRACELVLRPRISLNDILPFIPSCPLLNENDKMTLETKIKYAGYIAREEAECERQRKLEKVSIPRDLPYLSIGGISMEARERLAKIQPFTVGQASRIYGVNPADITALLLELKRRKVI